MTRESNQPDDRGFIMVALLISMAVGAIWMTVLLPAWRQQSIRQKEDDLVFRGESIARAIVFYQNKNQGANPPNLDILVEQRHLRKKYKDPMTGKDFDVVIAGQTVSSATGQPAVPIGTQPGRSGQPNQQGQPAGISGVRSPSNATSIKIYVGQQVYNMWQFDAQTVRQLYRMVGPQQQNQGPGRQGPAGPRGGPGATPAGPGRGPGGDRVSPGRGGETPPAPPVGPGRGRGFN